MPVSIEDIKALRDETGAGVMDCRNALANANGDLDKAKAHLRQVGGITAAKRADHEAREGLVEAYIHLGRIGALVEVNCETDFVARTDEFKTLVHDIAMQVASMGPRAVKPEDLPADDQDSPEELALLAQLFIKDPNKTVQDRINETVASTGEKIEVRRFIRFELAEPV